jgi:YVTN family beta-propeller protein
MLNALQSISSEIDSKSLLNKNLSSFLKDYFPINNDNKNDKIKAQVLVFDQLEELFKFYPDDNWREQQEDFFKQVAQALEENPLLRIVFVIREDYLAELDHFIEILPGRLRTRYRLERLGKDAALIAIKGPLERTNINLVQSSNINAINEEIEEIVNDLLKIRVEDPLTGETQEVNGEFVEPIQLQVVCNRWWKERNKGQNQIDVPSNTLNIQKNLKDLINVDSALEDFYAEAISESSTLTGIYEGDIRIWCEKKLITSSETRSFVHRGLIFTSGMPNKVIESLEKKYLIRSEEARWYELTHDRLIKPVLDSNRKWKNNLQSELKHRQKKHNIKMSGAVIAMVIALVSLGGLYFYLFPSADPSPLPIAINPSTNMIYASNMDGSGNDGNTISVIDGTTNQIVTDIPVPGLDPSTIAINPSTNVIYAADGNTISVIDGTTNQIVADIPVPGLDPSTISINPSTNVIYAANELYVTNSSDWNNTISVIDGTTNQIVADIPVPGLDPSTISINPSTNVIYAADRNIISVIDGTTNEKLGYIGLSSSNDIAVNPSTNMVYIANDEGYISVTNGTTHIIFDFIGLNNSQPTIDVNPSTNMIYATNHGDSGNNIIPTVSLSISGNDGNTISVIDGTTNQIVADIPVPGLDPSTIAVNPSTNMVYVASSGSYKSGDETILVIDGTTNQIVTDISKEDVPSSSKEDVPSSSLIKKEKKYQDLF